MSDRRHNRNSRSTNYSDHIYSKSSYTIDAGEELLNDHLRMLSHADPVVPRMDRYFTPQEIDTSSQRIEQEPVTPFKRSTAPAYSDYSFIGLTNPDDTQQGRDLYNEPPPLEWGSFTPRIDVPKFVDNNTSKAAAEDAAATAAVTAAATVAVTAAATAAVTAAATATATAAVSTVAPIPIVTAVNVDDSVPTSTNTCDWVISEDTLYSDIKLISELYKFVKFVHHGEKMNIPATDGYVARMSTSTNTHLLKFVGIQIVIPLEPHSVGVVLTATHVDSSSRERVTLIDFSWPEQPESGIDCRQRITPISMLTKEIVGIPHNIIKAAFKYAPNYRREAERLVEKLTISCYYKLEDIDKEFYDINLSNWALSNIGRLYMLNVSMLMESISKSNLEALMWLVKRSNKLVQDNGRLLLDPVSDLTRAITFAAQSSNVKMFKYLLYNIQFDSNRVMDAAVKSGHTELVNTFFEFKYEHPDAFRAAHHDNLNIKTSKFVANNSKETTRAGLI